MTNHVHSEHNGYEITGTVYTDGSIGWRCHALRKVDGEDWQASEYDDYHAIIAALDRYDLACRKKFVNKQAWIVKHGWQQEKTLVVEVEVTSITPDGKEVWVKEKTTRQGQIVEVRAKYKLFSIYASREACETYAKTRDLLIEQHRIDLDDLQTALNKTLWVPKQEAQENTGTSW